MTKKKESGAATYYYDGTFNGFLTVLYDIEYNGLQVLTLRETERPQDSLFPQPDYIETRMSHARVLWDRLRTEKYSALKTLYFAFMSNQSNLEGTLMDFFRVWRKNRASGKDIMYNPEFLPLFRLASEVEREKDHTERRLLAQQRFETTPVNFIRPKHDILPLISKRLRMLYRKSDWYVFDIRRKYGLHHQNGAVALIPFRSVYLKEGYTLPSPAETTEFPFFHKEGESNFTGAVA